MIRIALTSLVLSCVLSACQPEMTTVSETEAALYEETFELIPRHVLFGNAQAQSVKISHDGRYLAWVAPVDGVRNLWTAPVSRIDAATALTQVSDRDITNFEWAPDSRSLLYLRDTQGDETTKLFQVTFDKNVVALTPDPIGARFTLEAVSPKVAGKVVVTSNARDSSAPDLFHLDLNTRTLELIFENTGGYSRWVMSPDLNLMAVIKQSEGGGAIIEAPDGQLISEIPDGAFLGTYPLGTDADESRAYFMDSRRTNTSRVTAVELRTGRAEPLFHSERADADDALMHPFSGEPVAAAAVYARKNWVAIDPQYDEDFNLISSKLNGELSITSTSADFSKWIIHSNSPTAPGDYYLYERDGKTLTFLITSRPDLDGAPLQEQTPVLINSRDGLTLVSYLTTPPGWTPDSEPVPLVLHVHGGPWGRDRFGYSTWHQWLANRGYAVLSVNYRGSVGFGKDFVDASAGEFAGRMHDDLIDGVDWAIAEGIADPDRIAISGASYGGYAVLVGLSFTPDRFACGVNVVGISNLVTLIEGFPDYWAPYLENTWYKYVGNPADDADRLDLMARSPVSRADAISNPLLIAQGENDPRVPKSESDQIAERLIKRGVDVSYINFPDEGHGFIKRENRMAFYAVTEVFLAECLGGRAGPINNEFEASSIEFLHVGESLAKLGVDADVE